MDRLGSSGAPILLLLLSLWWWGSRAGLWNPFLLPGPGRVLSSLGDLAASGDLARHASVSLGRVVGGFLLACSAALPLGIGLGLRPAWSRRLYPLLEFLRHVPPLAVLPLLILWFGIGEASKLAVIFMAAFFPLFLNALDGIRRCDPGLVEVGRTLGFPGGRILRRIVLPSALPSILTGLRLGLGYSWRALIGAELIAAASGLGYLIHDAESLSRPDVIVAGVLALGLVGSLSDHLFFRFARRLVPWRTGDARDGWD
jgi:sulfonate transport system permease protein